MPSSGVLVAGPRRGHGKPSGGGWQSLSLDARHTGCPGWAHVRSAGSQAWGGMDRGSGDGGTLPTCPPQVAWIWGKWVSSG